LSVQLLGNADPCARNFEVDVYERDIRSLVA